MGELIPFPIRIRESDYWQFYDGWAVDGHWMSCTDCRRPLCFRAGKAFVACCYHSRNPRPPAPYDYNAGNEEVRE